MKETVTPIRFSVL